MVLEGDNLRSFGVENPNVTDIPQALFYLMRVIEQHRNSYFKSMKRDYEMEIDDWVGESVKHSEYIDLYTS
jgi:hypothetical protein